MATPDDFIEAARSYLGVRWHHLGRARTGVDCIGLLMCAADDCGLAYDDPPPYPRGHRGADLINACRSIGREIADRDAQNGDILLFSDSIFPCHVGIRSFMRNVPHVIHAHANRRKVIEEPLSDELRRALRMIYRPRVFELCEAV